MREFSTPADFPYPDAHTFSFDRNRLAFQLTRCQEAFREPDFRAVLQSFLADRSDPRAYASLLKSVRPLLRDAYEKGLFVFYRREAPAALPHDRLLMLDRYGVEWTFVRMDAYDSYQFEATFFRVAAGAPLITAVVSVRNRFGNAPSGASGAAWMDIRCGWSDFWRPDWSPPVIGPRRNPLDPR